MNIFESIIRALGLNKPVPSSLSEPAIQEYPNIQVSELKTHLELVEKHFSFLTNELGFKLTRSRMDGHEHTTVFSKANLGVHLVFAHGTLPWIYITNDLLPYDESKGLDNREIVQDYSNEMRTIMDIHSERLKPVYAKFNKKNNYDQKYFQEDFENFGREDYIRYMTLAGITTRDLILNQRGKIKSAQ